MDNDTATLQNALAVLRGQYGAQLAGPRQHTEAQMRHTLEQQMRLDELTADRLVKKLYETGKLVYMGTADRGTEPGTSTTGPVISMPSTQTTGGAPLITTADAALVMGSVRDPGGGDVAASQLGADAADAALTGAGAVSREPIRGGDIGHSVAENNEGATMGQLADTNVESRPAPITIGEHDEVEDDRTHGYWRIG